MPPIRSTPSTFKPVRTERTHEENQERAYIAASRRSDRSLEARVESARRASEIHKKRTGRSLRVREEDVMNEEMYEEEDDDLPNQYRRINALNPALGSMYNLNERLNSYVAGQIGVRNYLHQAIYSANQHRYQNQMFGNPMFQQGGMNAATMSPQAMNGFGPESQWPMMNNAQGMQPSPHGRSISVASPQEAAQYQQRPTMARNDSVASALDDRRASMPTQPTRPTIAPSPVATNTARSATSSHPPTPLASGPSPQQAPTPPQSGNTPSSLDGSMYPLTTKIPIETQQIIDGSSQYMNAVSPSQLTSGVPMPSSSRYSYHPNGRPQKCADANVNQTYTGLDQTLTPFAFSSQMTTPPMSEPQSAMSAPANLDFTFDENFTGMDGFNEFSMFNNANTSGQITPASNFDLNWDGADFFNYSEATG